MCGVARGGARHGREELRAPCRYAFPDGIARRRHSRTPRAQAPRWRRSGEVARQEREALSQGVSADECRARLRRLCAGGSAGRRGVRRTGLRGRRGGVRGVHRASGGGGRIRGDPRGSVRAGADRTGDPGVRRGHGRGGGRVAGARAAGPPRPRVRRPSTPTRLRSRWRRRRPRSRSTRLPPRPRRNTSTSPARRRPRIRTRTRMCSRRRRISSQETPEHDRLWFEQGPPQEFDFDK